MKLMQLNAYQGRLSRPLIKLIDTTDADIVCLQEAVAIDGESGFFATLAQLQAAGNYAYLYWSPTYGFKHMRRSATYGNAILSRQPFRTAVTQFTHLQYHPDFDISFDDTNVRNLQHVTVNTGKDPLHIINHHGYRSSLGKQGSKQTTYQIDRLVDYVEPLLAPLIIAGDFNLSPSSDSLKRINARYRNLSLIYGLETTRTVLAERAEVCDYVFTSDHVHVVSFSASAEVVSDHRPLLLEFDI